MTRPCRWPPWPEQNRQGCGADIIDVITVKGAKQVLDAKSEKRIVITQYVDGKRYANPVAAVVDTYVDHHATCSAFKAKVERERAAKQARP